MIRTIVIFLKDSLIEEIEKIREVHDPLFGLIPPHITLVFPFESDISNEILRQHITESTENIVPFYINVDQAVTNQGEYLFLLVEEGKEKILELHNQLYSSVLASFLREEILYIPHITVGRKRDEDSAVYTAEGIPLLHNKISFYIEKIAVERIGKNEESIIEFEVVLGGEY